MVENSLLLRCKLGNDGLELLLNQSRHFGLECIRERARIRAGVRHL